MATPVFHEETSLYEILIRVSPSGAWAAHYQTITEVTKNGEPFGTPNIDPVVPLNMEDAEAFAIVGQLMGDAAAKSLVLIAQLKEKAEQDAELIESLLVENEAIKSGCVLSPLDATPPNDDEAL